MKKSILLLTMLLVTSHICFTQEEWSLNKCIQYAIENSFDIHQSNLTIQTSEINTQQSKEQRMPNLSGGTNAFWNFGRSIDPTTNEFITTTFFSNGYSVNTGVSLYNGGRIKNEIEQSEAFEKVSLEQKSGAMNTLTINTVGAFFEVLFATDNLQNVDVQLKSINDQIDQMTKLVNAGSRAKFELYDLEAQKATSEQDQTIAQNRIDLAMLNLKALLNLPADYDMTLKKPDFEQEVFTNLELLSFDDAYQRAKDFQPFNRQLDHQIEAAHLGIEIAKSSFYPSIGFGGSLSTNFSNQGRTVDGFNNALISSDVLINDAPATISTEQQIPIFSNTPYGTQINDNFCLLYTSPSPRD